MLKTLSIDDSKAVHALLTEILEPLGVSLFHAYDGEEGLQALGGPARDGLDLVLLDWEMPVLTGIETLKQIRDRGIVTPVVMLTSKNAPEEILNALTLGATEYVMKPFTAEILVDKLQAVLGRPLG